MVLVERHNFINSSGESIVGESFEIDNDILKFIVGKYKGDIKIVVSESQRMYISNKGYQELLDIIDDVEYECQIMEEVLKIVKEEIEKNNGKRNLL